MDIDKRSLVRIADAVGELKIFQIILWSAYAGKDDGVLKLHPDAIDVLTRDYLIKSKESLERIEFMLDGVLTASTKKYI